MAQEAIRRHAASAFRYPQGGNPRLVTALADFHRVDARRLVVGNGSDEIIDLLIRILAVPGRHSLVCFEPCFSIYPIQGRISGVEVRRCPLERDFSFNFEALLRLVDESTRLVFVTAPDNPSGWCPPRTAVRDLAQRLAQKAPECLLVVDEAYMDFAENEAAHSLLAANELPENTAFLRTFSKSFGLAGLRLATACCPAPWPRIIGARGCPFPSISWLKRLAWPPCPTAPFAKPPWRRCAKGARFCMKGSRALGCTVWPSAANFLLFRTARGRGRGCGCFEALLRRGIIIRPAQKLQFAGSSARQRR